jgi:hypothetical protein
LSRLRDIDLLDLRAIITHFSTLRNEKPGDLFHTVALEQVCSNILHARDKYRRTTVFVAADAAWQLGDLKLMELAIFVYVQHPLSLDCTRVSVSGRLVSVTLVQFRKL